MSTGVLYYIVDDLRFVLDTLEASAAVDAAESKHTDKLLHADLSPTADCSAPRCPFIVYNVMIENTL